MKNQTLILLLVAGACGLVAMLGVKQHLSKKDANSEELQTIQVLVAANPIVQGDTLSELNTLFSTVNVDTCPEGVVTDLAQIEERSLKVSRVAGDYIFVDQLTERGQTGASAVIPKGMRVKTIPVDANKSHSGMLRPGNRIDLLLSDSDRDPTTGQQVRRVRPLLQYIEVFAVGAEVYGVNSGTGNAQARNISLLVTPQQMMILELADTKGEISTVLRSSADKDEIAMTGMTENDLEGAGTGTLNATSTLDVGDVLGGFALPPEEPEGIIAQLENEFGPVRSEPLVQEDDDEDFWTMAIYESGMVRVEKVNLKSDTPVEKSVQHLPLSGASKSDSPQGGLPSAPVGGLEGIEELDEGGLEELTSGLLDLFN